MARFVTAVCCSSTAALCQVQVVHCPHRNVRTTKLTGDDANSSSQYNWHSLGDRRCLAWQLSLWVSAKTLRHMSE